MKLIPLPALDDNYIWMLHDGQQALVVDPGDARPVLDALAREGVQLRDILVTHHHGDHTAGIAALRAATAATVCGPKTEPMPQPCQALSGGDTVHALGLAFMVMDVPGHTLGHIAYYAESSAESSVDDPILFCGDTLFSAGCGRLFEGTAAQMLASLQKLAALPAATRVCCTHEYTLSNLRFALEVEPDNAALRDYAEHCQRLRAQDLPTLPSTIATERRINPFLRTDVPCIGAAVRAHDRAGADRDGVFATLRQWKNHYP